MEFRYVTRMTMVSNIAVTCLLGKAVRLYNHQKCKIMYILYKHMHLFFLLMHINRFIGFDGGVTLLLCPGQQRKQSLST